jgi:hypothetical protein
MTALGHFFQFVRRFRGPLSPNLRSNKEGPFGVRLKNIKVQDNPLGALYRGFPVGLTGASRQFIFQSVLGRLPCMLTRSSAFWLPISFREASWLDGQAALIYLFMVAAFRHGLASAWRG